MSLERPWRLVYSLDCTSKPSGASFFFFCSRLLPCIKILPLHGDLSWVFTKLWDFEAFMDFELAFWQKSSAGG